MAGSATLTYRESAPVKSVNVAWTSDASGDVDVAETKEIYGEILRIVTNPTDGPTANYDVVVNDEDGLDVALGLLANRHTTNTEHVVPRLETTPGTTDYGSLVAVAGKLDVVVSNAGNAKSGVLRIIYR